jgi:hypothetical protein
MPHIDKGLKWGLHRIQLQNDTLLKIKNTSFNKKKSTNSSHVSISPVWRRVRLLPP